MSSEGAEPNKSQPEKTSTDTNPKKVTMQQSRSLIKKSRLKKFTVELEEKPKGGFRLSSGNEGEATITFAADVMLGGLARYLLLAGRDCFYRRHIDDPNLAQLAHRQDRVLVTKDRRLLERHRDLPAFNPSSDDPEEQFQRVVEEYELILQREDLFSRCPECNMELESVRKESVREQIPERTRQWLDEYYQCPYCEKIYWKGSHYRAIRDRFEEWGLL